MQEVTTTTITMKTKEIKMQTVKKEFGFEAKEKFNEICFSADNFASSLLTAFGLASNNQSSNTVTNTTTTSTTASSGSDPQGGQQGEFR